MDREFNDSQPIYRQLRDRVVAMILDGVAQGGRSAAFRAHGGGRIPGKPDHGVEGLSGVGR